MHKQNRKFQLLNGLIAIVALAFAVGCRGFFVNPTLSTLTVGPATPTIQQGTTLQFIASGTNDDGLPANSLTSKAFWSTSDSTVASINTTGLVTAVSPGTATITAAVGTVSGSTTVTVTLGNITSIALIPANSTLLQGQTEQFTATATTSDGTKHDITSSATWASSNINAGTINSSGLFTAVTAVTSSQVTTISATSGNITGQATLTVNQ